MMKLGISNIAWDMSQDSQMYEMMKHLGFRGLEIAPTRIFPENPYQRLDEAKQWSQTLRETYDLVIPSMQSIWFGKTEKLFETQEERDVLLDYTKAAIRFAEAVGCGNLVFGSPKNRNIPETEKLSEAYDVAGEFFYELGEYAAEHHTVLAMEANPPMYNTNFINNTKQAIDMVKRVNSKGFRVNLDLGTMIAEDEHMETLAGAISYINHVHISEPGLKKIEKRGLHKELITCLKAEQYQGCISIEMAKGSTVQELQEIMEYVKQLTENAG